MREIYYKYLDRLKGRLIKKYDKLGLRASGKYEKSLEAEVTRGISKDRLIMYGEHYAYFMEHGRGPTAHNAKAGKKGKRLKDKIKEWLMVKFGKSEKEAKEGAFPISQKIHEEGIKVPNEYNAGNVISDPINEFMKEDVPQMLDEIGAEQVASIRSDILEILKK